MITALILITALSGFILQNINPHLYYKIHRFGGGQHLYLQSAMWGLLCLIVAITLNFASYHILLIPSYCECEVNNPINYSQTTAQLLEYTFGSGNDGKDYISAAWITTTILLTLLVPLLGNYIFIKWEMYKYGFSINIRKDKDIEKEKKSARKKYKAFCAYLALSESPLDSLIVESMLRKKQLLFSMNDRKVYVGVVNTGTECNETEAANREIVINPLASGYRNAEDLQVIFTTVYDLPDIKFNVVLKQENINTISEFNFSVYEKLNNKSKSNVDTTNNKSQ